MVALVNNDGVVPVVRYTIELIHVPLVEALECSCLLLPVPNDPWVSTGLIVDDCEARH